MKRVALLFVLLSLVLAVRDARDARAYTLTGFKFDHNRLTYSCGSPLLAQAVRQWAGVSALEDGGCSATPDIRLEIIPLALWPYGDALGVGRPGYVAVRSDQQELAWVYLHEVGHAIGLGHSAETWAEPDVIKRSAAMYFICCNPISSDDIAGVQALYGWQRMWFPAVASDGKG